jgi:phage terminase large subunit-like protein
VATLRLNPDAVRFRRFCREFLVYTEGSVAGQPVEFEPWQLEQTNNILSRDAAGRRRYTTAYIGLAKKNNKSTWGAALALYFLVVESQFSRTAGCRFTRRRPRGIRPGLCSVTLNRW